MVMKMYELKKEYKEYKGKDEIKDHLPEWIHILQNYFRKNYYSSSLKPEVKKRKR